LRAATLMGFSLLRGFPLPASGASQRPDPLMGFSIPPVRLCGHPPKHWPALRLGLQHDCLPLVSPVPRHLRSKRKRSRHPEGASALQSLTSRKHSLTSSAPQPVSALNGRCNVAHKVRRNPCRPSPRPAAAVAGELSAAFRLLNSASRPGISSLPLLRCHTFLCVATRSSMVLEAKATSEAPSRNSHIRCLLPRPKTFRLHPTNSQSVSTGTAGEVRPKSRNPSGTSSHRPPLRFRSGTMPRRDSLFRDCSGARRLPGKKPERVGRVTGQGTRATPGFPPSAKSPSLACRGLARSSFSLSRFVLLRRHPAFSGRPRCASEPEACYPSRGMPPWRLSSSHTRCPRNLKLPSNLGTDERTDDVPPPLCTPRRASSTDAMLLWVTPQAP
jgi:hypothetical protein